MKSTFKATLSAVTLATLMLTATNVHAQVERAQVDTEGVNEILGRVVKADSKSRDLLIRGPGGGELAVHAGPQVRNFDQIKAGDLITLAYREALITDLKKAPLDSRPSLTIADATEQAAPGAKPSMEKTRIVNITGRVVGVNRPVGGLIIEGPSGQEQSVILPPQQRNRLADVHVGDLIQATYTQRMVLSVKKS